MRKSLTLVAVLASLAFAGYKAQAQAADSCCTGGKCGTCCVNCTKCGSNCSPATCCKK